MPLEDSSVIRRLSTLAPLIVVLAVLACGEVLACPTCKDAVNTSDPDGLNVARGYFYSILLMLAMPFTLVASFGAYVWRETRRQKAGSAHADDQSRIEA